MALVEDHPPLELGSGAATVSKPLGVFARPTATHGWKSWLFTVDHKKLGIMYGCVAMFFFLVGGIEALRKAPLPPMPSQDAAFASVEGSYEAAAGVTIRVIRDGDLLAFAGSPEFLKLRAALGVWAPVRTPSRPALPPEALDLILVPGLAFDPRTGARLGRGGGYYDRTLAALQRRPRVIGIGFEQAAIDSIRPCPHDVPMRAIVTDRAQFLTDLQRFANRLNP